MSNGFTVDDHSGFAEARPPVTPQPLAIRIVANLLSYVFHPLFIPVYIAWFMVSELPGFFLGADGGHKELVLARFFMTYCLFPLVTVGLLKGLGFIQSIFLRTRKERIIPFIACNIYYFWLCYVVRHQGEYAREVIQLTLAIFLASSIGVMLNVYMKVSLHAISMGILAAFMVLLGLTQSIPFGLYVSVAFIIAGLVCTARFIASDHTQREVYFGFLCGAASILLAVWADKILP